jgi:glutamate dehydrogenase (NAD(P)+)
VVCDPKNLPKADLEKITRRYITDLGNSIGPHQDIPAPDVNTNAETMAWIYDTYDTMHKGQNNLGVVTGKPVNIGGSYGRQQATARGVLFATQQALGRGVVQGLSSVEGATVVVQGYGNAGYNAAWLFAEAGARILAVSDSRGGVFDPAGLDPARALEHKRATGSVTDLEGARNITNKELLALPCDILIPAALENQIRADNAADVQARFVAEAANGPTTPAADRILFGRDIPVLPDILANAGGVTVSYFEWVQNRQGYPWSLEKVRQRLSDMLVTAFGEIWQIHESENVTVREAAYRVALQRIDAAIEIQGTRKYFTGD